MRLWLLIIVCLCLSACTPQVTSAPSPTVPVTTGPVTANRTAGCGLAAPTALPSRLNVGGRVRDFITVVPADYRPDRAYPLVVAFHGRTNSSTQARAYFGLETAMPDTIFVYPSGLRSGGSYTWSDPGDPPDALRDYAFFDDIVRVMSVGYCLEPNRVFVVGHSLGAWFANSLACARAGVVRAVASLGGGVGAESCRGQVAAMILHNPNDRLVPVAQGEAARDTFRTLDGANRRECVFNRPASTSVSLCAVRRGTKSGFVVSPPFRHALRRELLSPHLARGDGGGYGNAFSRGFLKKYRVLSQK